MPKERKFDFLPITNESLRKKKQEEKEDQIAYVRIQKPYLLIFPEKTLTFLGLKEGDVASLKFYIDDSKRAIAFKINPKIGQSDLKDLKTMKVKKQASGKYFITSAMISIGSILTRFADVEMPAKFPIQTYTDNDAYLGIGEVHYFVIPKKKVDEKELSQEAKEVQSAAGIKNG